MRTGELVVARRQIKKGRTLDEDIQTSLENLQSLSSKKKKAEQLSLDVHCVGIGVGMLCLVQGFHKANEGIKTPTLKKGQFCDVESSLMQSTDSGLDTSNSTIDEVLNKKDGNPPFPPPRTPKKHHNDANSLNEVKSQNEKTETFDKTATSTPKRTLSEKTNSDHSEFSISSSKSRQKKFHRHFKTVSLNENVLDYYTCALVRDILLQGILYITENYFAFYSNVFGYVTKLLIPVDSVVRITKERTAKVFPNAVGVTTRSEKHVFASLISRDSTIKLMQKVWEYNIEQEAKEVVEIQRREAEKMLIIKDMVEISSCESGSGGDSPMGSHYSPNFPLQKEFEKMKLIQKTPPIPPFKLQKNNSLKRILSLKNVPNSNKGDLKNGFFSSAFFGRGPSLLVLATGLLILLFLSAAVLLSRISELQEKIHQRPSYQNPDQFYKEFLGWQRRLHSNSADEIYHYIDINFQQIVKVRESLEALSHLFNEGGGNFETHQQE